MKKKMKLKIVEKQDFQCKHYAKEKGVGYTFSLNDTEEITICGWCFTELAPEVMKQVVLEHCIDSELKRMQEDKKLKKVIGKQNE